VRIENAQNIPKMCCVCDGNCLVSFSLSSHISPLVGFAPLWTSSVVPLCQLQTYCVARTARERAERLQYVCVVSSIRCLATTDFPAFDHWLPQLVHVLRGAEDPHARKAARVHTSASLQEGGVDLAEVHTWLSKNYCSTPHLVLRDATCCLLVTVSSTPHVPQPTNNQQGTTIHQAASREARTASREPRAAGSGQQRRAVGTAGGHM